MAEPRDQISKRGTGTFVQTCTAILIAGLAARRARLAGTCTANLDRELIIVGTM